jgi:tellurite resistance protein TerC
MSGTTPVWAWFALVATIVSLLAIDLVVHRGARGASRRAALVWTLIWIAAGLLFNGVVWLALGPDKGQQYLAAYLIEKSLSVDNLFLFLVIFASMNIRTEYQRTVLSWGIFGALVFRGIFIFLGVTALERWSFIGYIFGGLLVLAAMRAFKEDPTRNKENHLIKLLSRHLPLTEHVESSDFFVKQAGKRVATPLLLAIIAVELSDVFFAFDSIPAAFSVSHDRFIVFSTNAFAILGLRALYIVVAKSLKRITH